MRPVDVVEGSGPGAAGAVSLPRAQSGSAPQHLLTTLIGDYWFGRSEHLPSAALVRLLEEFGITTLAARAALSRLTLRGLLESSKVGRRTYYGLTPRAAAVLADGEKRIMSFGLEEDDWDGQWTIVGFSVPEERRDLRHAVRSHLRWLGFAPLYDGMWVSPRASIEQTNAALADLGVENATAFRGSHVPGACARPPEAAWDVAELDADYRAFIGWCHPLLDRVNGGRIGPAEALIARTRTMDTWRSFPGKDPRLPPSLLPANWPRTAAREAFVAVYDTLGPLAELRVRQIVAEFAPEAAPLVSHHTSSSRTGS